MNSRGRTGNNITFYHYEKQLLIVVTEKKTRENTHYLLKHSVKIVVCKTKMKVTIMMKVTITELFIIGSIERNV